MTWDRTELELTPARIAQVHHAMIQRVMSAGLNARAALASCLTGHSKMTITLQEPTGGDTCQTAQLMPHAISASLHHVAETRLMVRLEVSGPGRAHKWMAWSRRGFWTIDVDSFDLYNVRQ